MKITDKSHLCSRYGKQRIFVNTKKKLIEKHLCVIAGLKSCITGQDIMQKIGELYGFKV